MNGKVIIRGTKNGNLYYVGAQDFSDVALMAKTAETPQLWHRRFAHLGYDNLATMATNSMFQGMSVEGRRFQERK
eukprot:334898-Chlamydomonas_euryale.AAC.1